MLSSLSPAHGVDTPSRAPAKGAPRAAGHAVVTSALDEVGWRIGWDHARHGLTPPHDHLHPGHPVREGWAQGRQRWAGCTRSASPAVERTLALRLACWREGRALDDFSVTPRLLARLDQGRCPVTRRPYGVGDDAAQAMPLYAGAACAAGNVALVSAAAASAARGLGFALARHTAAQVQDGVTHRGLDGPAWRRLATLIGLATPLPHDKAVHLPLHLLPPVRCRLVNPAQALQTLISAAVLHAQAADTPGMEDIADTLPSAARRPYHRLASALVARRLEVPRRADAPLREREAIEDAWAQERVMQCWLDMASCFDHANCERVVKALTDRPHRAGNRWRWMSDAETFDGWACVPDGGDAAAQTGHAAGRADSAPPPAGQRLQSYCTVNGAWSLKRAAL